MLNPVPSDSLPCWYVNSHRAVILRTVPDSFWCLEFCLSLTFALLGLLRLRRLACFRGRLRATLGASEGEERWSASVDIGVTGYWLTLVMA